ncbi:hypothetical protein [Phenylobacterium sp.]|uniref:hypothetical protein n=1 Tax=Phenylobacterium sp. TaxID=1871053 RepID=UPI002733FC0B|nr:hypothetical protein [Phenylobacterium sp.]MDP3659441.1 hypothetical protein [Phenylobacterium sp.]
MSCADLAVTAVLWLAAATPGAATPAPLSPEPSAPAGAVAYEPLFADIVARATRLRGEAGAAEKNKPLPGDFAQRIKELSDLDMKGHVTLRERGTDGDLKCILKGISEDLPLKLQAVTAASGNDRVQALQDLVYLLNDNVEVITSPPRPPV